MTSPLPPLPPPLPPTRRHCLPLIYCPPLLQLVRENDGPDASFEGLKLHRPAASCTSHPLWGALHCSFGEACTLLAGGLANEFLKLPATAGGPHQGREGSTVWYEEEEQQQTGEGSQLTLSSSATEEGGGGSGGGGGGLLHAGRASDRWQGLYPADTGCYSVRL